MDNILYVKTATAGCYETNVPLSYVIRMLTAQQADRPAWNVVMYDLTGISSTAENKYRMVPDMETVEYAKTLMQQVLDGQTLDQDEIPYTIGETYTVNLGDPELNKMVQARLNELGYNCGAVDGVIGQQTADAINAYRLDAGITYPGKVDRELCNSLEIVIPKLSPTEEESTESVSTESDTEPVTTESATDPPAESATEASISDASDPSAESDTDSATDPSAESATDSPAE